MKINRKYLMAILIIFVIAIGAATVVSAYTGTGFSHNIPESKYSSLSIDDILDKYNDTTCKGEKTGVCTKVVDGDTIYVEGVGKIRLVGVNTPEKGVTGGATSTAFVKKLCLNKEVSLDVDDSKNHDKYGRTLAVVIVDGKNLNEILLKEGLAEIMFIPPSEFNPHSWDSTAQDTPEKVTYNSDSSSSDSSGDFVGNSNSHKFHKSSCKWAKKIGSSNKVTFSSRDEAINQGYQACKVCSP